MIASTKSYELAVHLNEISQQISFEDVQIAITLLIQCTSNILNVNNVPCVCVSASAESQTLKVNWSTKDLRV